MNRLTTYFKERTPTSIDEQGAHYDDPLWLGQANCPVPDVPFPQTMRYDEPIEFAEHEPGVDPGVMYLLAAGCVFWAVLGALLTYVVGG